MQDYVKAAPSHFPMIVPRSSNFGALGAWGWESGVWHLAAFLAGLPSMEAEIDDKLPYNSR